MVPGGEVSGAVVLDFGAIVIMPPTRFVKYLHRKCWNICKSAAKILGILKADNSPRGACLPLSFHARYGFTAAAPMV